jgi:glucose-1-phosphate cytidylyltransferase
MKAVILAGGKGTRLSEETLLKPKPLVTIGDMPILWHIMKIYSQYGVDDFVICCGYKGYMIKEYFANYFLRRSDVTFDMASNEMRVHQRYAEPWKVTLVDTGQETMTGGRLLRVKEYVNQETFCFTYGDGISDVNVARLIGFHREQGAVATVTATQHYSRFGVLKLNGQYRVKDFVEKPRHEGSWMNSGFFVLEPKIFDYIDGDETVFEREPIQRLVRDGQLASFIHDGFFQGMDSMREKIILEEMWTKGEAPWKVWNGHDSVL